MKQEKSYNVGVGPMFILFITFLVLKLAHVIDWSWLFVTMPLWVGAAFILSLIVLIFMLKVLAAIIGKSMDRIFR